jgi:hypothetical protein
MKPPTPTHYLLHVGEGRNLFYIIARSRHASWPRVLKIILKKVRLTLDLCNSLCYCTCVGNQASHFQKGTFR